MGAVYQVLDRELDEDVALKILQPALAATPDALRRFRREVKLARRVTHPNVARTYDLGEHQGTRFLTMELLQGSSLAKLVGQDIPLAQVLRIGLEIARGLAAAHAAGIIHRDLKPDNVMLVGDRVIITDFGIARAAEPGSDPLSTSAGSLVGTPAYMAPEQIECKPVDGRTDVYALGVLLYELLTGRLPFKGDSAVAMAAARLVGPVPDPRAVRPGMVDGVAELVMEMLGRVREKRPDAQMLVERFEALSGVGGQVFPTPVKTTPSANDWSVQLDSRSVLVRPFEAAPPHEPLARDLRRAIADALVAEKRLTVVPGDDAPADLLVEGAVAVSGARARARLRITDPRRGAVIWADKVEAPADDPFALEDAAANAVKLAVRERAGESRGPTDPKLRARYEEARAAYERFGPNHAREAIKLLEELHAEHPQDAWVMSLHSLAVARLRMQTGAVDPALLARAEELAVRAVEADPTIGATYHAIALIRLQTGDFRACVRAEQEALRRSPLHAEAHSVLGRLLAWTGHVDEGLRRIELAIRLDPRVATGHIERAVIAALSGDRERAEESLRVLRELGGPMGGVMLESRFAIWWRDRALAARVADALEGSKTGASWEKSAPLLRHYANGEAYAGAREVFRQITSDRVSPRHRCMMHQIAAEYFAEVGEKEDALRHIEDAVQLPYIDLLWLDRCPSLESLRADPRWSAARALVAARAAQIWQ
jgi:serine/threonine-protein kinase